MTESVRILFIGDIVGRPGRTTVAELLPKLRDELEPDFVVVNGENVSGGMGLNQGNANKLLSYGIDVITLGNHAFKHKDVFRLLDTSEQIVRPANYMETNPGKGWTVASRNGVKLAVVNLSGTYMLTAAYSPFTTVEMLLPTLEREADIILVDFHAETTSEKIAMGWHLDGRVAAVLGTHTHVPTADAKILPGGTAYITDVGMTGSQTGVLGVKKELILKRFLTQMPVRFDPAEGDEHLMAVLVTADRSGRAQSIEQVIRPL